MHILITGGTGFIGKQLCLLLLAKKYEISVLCRDIHRAKAILPFQINCIQNISDIKHILPIDAIINLAGHPIANMPWFPKTKQAIIESRVYLTQNLVKIFQDLDPKPCVFISGSAIGYYGMCADEKLTEEAPVGTGFAADLCKEWELAALTAQDQGIRTCCIRTGLVLGKAGGILKRMRLPYLLGLGGKMGTGHQWMSWIHMQDYLSILLFCLENTHIQGAVNATAPNPVTNLDFARSYAHILKRPAFMTMPGWLLKLLLGQMAEELLLAGQRVIPQKLMDLHFSFKYPQIDLALQQIERQSSSC